MADIKITRSHHFSEDEVQEKVNQLAKELVSKHGGNYRQQGKTVYYTTTGVDANLSHNDNSIQIEVTLGFLMKGLKGLLKDEIENTLNRYV